MSFTDIFIRRPVLATVVSLLILLVGLASGFNLPVRQFPKITNTTFTVTTIYPGANADLIKGFITVPIQQAVASAEGIDTLTSSSQQNVSIVTLNLRLDASPDRAVADVLSKIQQVKSVLPRESQDPIVIKQTGESTALMYLSFNSKVMGASQITDYITRVIQPRLQTINGVANAQILGGQTFAMRIWLSPDKMAALGVTPVDVRNALATNNFVTAAGHDQRRNLARQCGGLRQIGRGHPRRRVDPPRRHLHHRARAGERRFLIRIRRAEGRLHRHLCDADREPPHRHR
jgi:multidrug efflux pump